MRASRLVCAATGVAGTVRSATARASAGRMFTVSSGDRIICRGSHGSNGSVRSVGFVEFGTLQPAEQLLLLRLELFLGDDALLLERGELLEALENLRARVLVLLEVGGVGL